MNGRQENSGIRLADLVATFSLATDLGLGQPMEHVLRSWLIAARLGERLGLDDPERAGLYYVSLLAWVGCVADTPDVAQWFGDDIAYRGDSYQVDLAGLPMVGFMLRHVGAGSPALHRLRLGASLMVTGGRAVERVLMSHCLTTATMAERLGLGPDVRDPLQQVFTRWDGQGVPAGVGGEEIARSVRLFQLADIAEVFHRAGGVEAAADVARERRGRQFDPVLVDEFCRAAPEVLEAVPSGEGWGTAIDAEPALQARLTEAQLDEALEALADFTDLRSTFLVGHSRGVAALAGRAAQEAGLPTQDVVVVHRAGLVHDLGRHGVPASIWDKPGPLNHAEAERVRLHAYYTERMLAGAPALARLVPIAAAHHERLDGSGYHKGLPGAALAPTARILAAADAYHAMTEPRPHRRAWAAQESAGELRAEVRRGRLGDEAVDAVLTAAGQKHGKRRTGPSGLTPREVEVLTLIARGASRGQVARVLGIRPRTAGTHVERIYMKIGASSRSTATLFAMKHGLLDTVEPFEDFSR